MASILQFIACSAYVPLVEGGCTEMIRIKPMRKERTMNNSALKDVAVEGRKDNVQVISMLYDGALNFIRIAKEKTEIGDVTGKTLYTNKAKAIIAELSNALVMDSGEISQNLRQLYEFTMSSLVDADVHDDLNAYGNAEKVIEILSDGWKEMQKVQQTDFDSVIPG
jgi:flagellar protein FliS